MGLKRVFSKLGYSLEQAQVVGIVGIVGMVGMVWRVGINKQTDSWKLDLGKLVFFFLKIFCFVSVFSFAMPKFFPYHGLLKYSNTI